jgi:elongation factor P hydroxylase
VDAAETHELHELVEEATRYAYWAPPKTESVSRKLVVGAVTLPIGTNAPPDAHVPVRRETLYAPAPAAAVHETSTWLFAGIERFTVAGAGVAVAPHAWGVTATQFEA